MNFLEIPIIWKYSRVNFSELWKEYNALIFDILSEIEKDPNHPFHNSAIKAKEIKECLKIQYKYDAVYLNWNQMIVTKDWKSGIIDKDYNEILPIGTYMAIYPIANWYKVLWDDGWGFINFNMDIIVKPDLKVIFDNYNGKWFSISWDNWRWFIDSNMKTIIEPKYKSLRPIKRIHKEQTQRSFDDNYFKVSIKKDEDSELFWVIDKNWNKVIDMEYKYIKDFYENWDAKCFHWELGRWLVNLNGEFRKKKNPSKKDENNGDNKKSETDHKNLTKPDTKNRPFHDFFSELLKH